MAEMDLFDDNLVARWRIMVTEVRWYVWLAG